MSVGEEGERRGDGAEPADEGRDVGDAGDVRFADVAGCGGVEVGFRLGVEDGADDGAGAFLEVGVVDAAKICEGRSELWPMDVAAGADDADDVARFAGRRVGQGSHGYAPGPRMAGRAALSF